MNTRILHRAAPILLAAGLCLSVSALAADELPAVTIGAGVMTKADAGRSATGTPLEKVTITHRVSYADLDLKTRAGATELEKRIKATARTACKQLHDLYPMEVNVGDCVKTTLADASPQVHSVVAAAREEASAE